MAKSDKGKVPGGKGPEQENPRNRASTHVHNTRGSSWTDNSGKKHLSCTCGQDMGTE